MFLLMGKEYRISRSIRAQWFFQQFNSTLPSPKPKDELVSFRLNKKLLNVSEELYCKFHYGEGVIRVFFKNGRGEP